jgi:hypothetical protein
MMGEMKIVSKLYEIAAKSNCKENWNAYFDGNI